MDEKQAPPPTYADVSGGGPPAASNYNAGYAPPQGDQGGVPPAAGVGGYPPAAGGGGYPPAAGVGGYPPAAGYPPNYGYPGYPPQQGAPQQQYGYSNQTVVVNQPGRQAMHVNQVPDNMGLAIFTTICCCWPLGLVAIMRASESRRCLAAGDVTSASRYSQEARRFSMWAIAGGVISIILAIVLVVVVVVTRVNSYNAYDDNYYG